MNNKKKRKIIIIILLILIFLVVIILLFLKILKKSTKSMYENLTGQEIVYTGDINTRGVGMELILAIEGEVDWKNLNLTDNFKNKFKKSNDIMRECKIYKSFLSGISHDYENKQVIIIYATKFDNLIDIYGDKDKATEYFYEYEIINNLLNDVRLIDKYDVYAINGEKVYD